MNSIKKEILCKNINLYHNSVLDDNILEKIKNDKSIRWKTGANIFSMSLSNEIKPSKYKRGHIENFPIKENPDIKLLTREIGFSCLPAIKDYCNEYGVNFSWIQDTIFMKYEKENFINHKYYSLGYEEADFCVIISLNNDYIGGNINFVNKDISIKLEKNQILIFPNEQEYAYDIEKIQDKTKYDCLIFLSKEEYENPYNKK